MRRLLLIAALLSPGTYVCARDLAVFGENDAYVIGPDAARQGPSAPKRAAFLDAYAADVASRSPLKESAALVNPPSWGKTVSAATGGTLLYHAAFAGGFVCHLTLSNLAPNHRYILTLNGNPSRAGNSLLLTPVTQNAQERYYDFQFVTTDAAGSFDGGFGIFLTPGDYDVRCYVKDTDDFKIVLYRDFFTFRVL